MFSSQPVFIHGQLYVVLSESCSQNNLKMQIGSDHNLGHVLYDESVFKKTSFTGKYLLLEVGFI
jgi:hypothetical protein